MSSEEKVIKEQRYKRWIIGLSIILPLAIALLFGIKIEGYDFSFLPPIYASTNGLTAILLILALIAIKKGNQKLHQRLMQSCLVLSALFLIMYVIYHITSESTSFGGEGVIKYVYFFVLITHIVLSVVIVPFVLFTYLRALLGKYEMHKKLARITFPLWLYVAATGAIVYLMISPYYQ